MYNSSMATHSLTTLSSSTATRLTPPGIHSGIEITIQNVNASGYIYLGSEGVTAENYGYRILPNHAISIELNGRDSLYAISSGSNMKAAVLKTNLETGV
jgi:hypothetical protein